MTREEFMYEALTGFPWSNRRFGRARFITTAAIVPFGKWDYYYTKDPIEWISDQDSSEKIRVESGFVTDLASIPSIFYSILPRTAKYTYPAIIHDYLYWFQPCERGEADDLFLKMMREMGVERGTAATIHIAVSTFGNGPWSENRLNRSKGERRFLKQFPKDARITWEEWKERQDVFADAPV